MRGMIRKGPSSSSSQREYRNSRHDDKPESNTTVTRSAKSTPHHCPSFLSRLLFCFKPSQARRRGEFRLQLCPAVQVSYPVPGLPFMTYLTTATSTLLEHASLRKVTRHCVVRDVVQGERSEKQACTTRLTLRGGPSFARAQRRDCPLQEKAATPLSSPLLFSSLSLPSLSL